MESLHLRITKQVRGFTLIEMLVVISIIGILASLALASYSSVSRNARDSRRKADVEEVRAAIELYRSRKNVYPTGPLPWGSALCDPPDCTGDKYMETVPQDPQNGKAYYYTASGVDYTIGVALENVSPTCSPVVSCGSSFNCSYCIGPYGQKQ